VQSFDFDFALRQCCGDRERTHRLLSRFAERVSPDCAEIRQAADADDADGVRRLAHRMKGSAATLAVHAVRALAAQVEELAASQHMDRARALLGELEQACATFADEIRALSATHPDLQAGGNPRP
jgi:HPt (histidine-containing phosphotransfer) domain-containing protein